MDVRVDRLDVCARLSRRLLDRLRRRRLARERSLHARQADRVRARTSQPDTGGPDRALGDVERRRDADDREVRRALVELGVGGGLRPAQTARRR